MIQQHQHDTSVVVTQDPDDFKWSGEEFKARFRLLSLWGKCLLLVCVLLLLVFVSTIAAAVVSACLGNTELDTFKIFAGIGGSTLMLEFYAVTVFYQRLKLAGRRRQPMATQAQAFRSDD
jgi:hypothetical protein